MENTKHVLLRKVFQQPYQENEEIYSPMARANTLKILSVACINGWNIEQMDVETAFLNGNVYIYPPYGYVTDSS